MLNENLTKKEIGSMRWLFLILFCSQIILGIPRCNKSPAVEEVPEADVTIECSEVVSQSQGEYGTNTWWSDQHATIWTNRWRELNINIIRIPVILGMLEPVNDNSDPNEINWNGFYFNNPVPWSTVTITWDNWIIALRDAGVTIMLCTSYNAPWNSAIDEDVYSTTPQSYSLIDKNLPVGIYYYRLKQIDMDGLFKYSNIVKTKVWKKKKEAD